jgi:bifunctional N-acetylglucosamine-1-phosphate-uridyltransferase/glucosamine-1-phosphate-acetyltransferase GlmU-like protein
MGESINKIQVVVLAAGQGKRMANKELPKVLVSFRGVPLIKHLLKSIKESQVCIRPVIVVGQKAELVKEALGSDYDYVTQTEQFGTGHAVAATRIALENKAQNILVLYGDHPFVSADTIKKLVADHIAKQATITMATVKVDNFTDWRQGFDDFGRVLRNIKGEICGIVEKRDATPKQLKITELNPAYFCFNAVWLWHNLTKLKNNNIQSEYYITDLVTLACTRDKRIASITISEKEALGVNTAEQLKLLENIN